MNWRTIVPLIVPLFLMGYIGIMDKKMEASLFQLSVSYN